MQSNPVDNSKNFLSDLFFPKFCFGCQKEGFYLCEDCRELVEILEYDYCLCEGHPFGLGPNLKTGKCNKCSGRKLSGLYFAVPFKDNLIKKLIYQFKYPPYTKDLAKTLASLIIEHLVKSGKNTNEIWAPNGVPAVLIPVPIYKSKLKERGYNQSDLLATELSKILQTPVFPDVLIKIKSTASQMELKKQEREKNLMGAFVIKNPERISGKKVFLVDDVYTTGSTMQECALVLRNAGAKSVWGLTIAREE